MRAIFTVFLIILTCLVKGQTKNPDSYKSYFQEGLYLLLENNYEKAQESFEQAYKIDSSSANINYVLGICYLNSALKKKLAEPFFSKAVKNISRNYKAENPNEKAAPPLSYFYYGKALHINYKFDEALARYDDFTNYVDARSKDWKKMVDKEKATSILAKEMVANPINIQIDNMGDSINSRYPEYSAVLSADERTIIFTTRRPSSTGGLVGPDGQYFEDIVVAYKDDLGHWTKPVSLSSNVNTDGNEASINLTADGQTLIVYRDDSGNGNLYYTTYDGKDWTPLKEFGSDINTKYFESHACLNVDASILFFTSDRPGGFGGRDIYRCIKLPNGNWSKALNVGAAINTEYDEDGAFMHPDGQTFFFASKGSKTMGGFDIMFATLNEDNQFVDVTNIGYPINTTDDDAFYVTSPDGKRSYFTSAKDGGFGEKDIYQLYIPESKEAFLALFKGQIVPAEGEKLPENLMVVVKDKVSGKVIGTYLPKLVNGTFTTILPPGKDYNFSYQSAQGEEFYNEDIFVTDEQTYREIKREVMLEPVKLIGKVKAKEKSIALNVISLENGKNKKIVPNAKVTVMEEGGEAKTYQTNANGRYDAIALKTGKKYTAYAELGENKSAVATINTAGVMSGKIINQILYLQSKPAKSTSKELLLGVMVKNSRTLKIIPNANITLTDSEGENYDVTTNEKGEIEGIELSPDTKYELRATTSDGSISEKQTLSTKGVNHKRFNKTLFIDPDTKTDGPDYAALSKRKKTTSRELLLGVIVRNSKTFKIIPNVKISLIDADGEYYDVTTNEKGEINGIELSPDTKYEITAISSEGTVSKKQAFSTVGVKRKNFNKTIFLDQADTENADFKAVTKRKKTTSRELLLGVIVRNSRTMKIIPNVKITLVDADGEYYDVTTNEKGEISGIELSPNTRYEITAIGSDGSVSKKQAFSTIGVKHKNFTKTLYIDQPDTDENKSGPTTTSVDMGGDLAEEFEIYYKYNRNKVEDMNEKWSNFIQKIADATQIGLIKVNIRASASKVPTRKFKSNQQLANTRAINLQRKITEAVVDKGGKKENLKFVRKAFVGGPAYKGDWKRGRAKYEKHQFAKVKLK